MNVTKLNCSPPKANTIRMLKKDPNTKVDSEMEKAISTNLPNVFSAEIRRRT